MDGCTEVWVCPPEVKGTAVEVELEVIGLAVEVEVVLVTGPEGGGRTDLVPPGTLAWIPAGAIP